MAGKRNRLSKEANACASPEPYQRQFRTDDTSGSRRVHLSYGTSVSRFRSNCRRAWGVLQKFGCKRMTTWFTLLELRALRSVASSFARYVARRS